MNDDLTASTAVEASASQAVANRSNAAKSTGPKSAAGKLAVAKNGIGHGIYALCPVIEGVESAADWKRYRREMLASLLPVGMVEATLAERIILNALRLQRAARYETEQIRLAHEEAPAGIAYDFKFDRDRAAVKVEKILSDAVGHEEIRKILQLFADASDETSLAQDAAENLVYCFDGQPGVPEGFFDFARQCPVPVTWTVGVIRQLLRDWIQKQPGSAIEEIQTRMVEQATAKAAQASQLARKVERALENFRLKHLLPDEVTLEKVMRYEAHLSRQFHRDLHELQRLQAMRGGLPVAVPAAIDIDVVGGTNRDLGGGE